jgi:repressor of nif and glnA expression
MEAAIEKSIEELAKLGVRMLSPETAQSGVALQLRNAAQTAQLSSLCTKLSATIRQIIAQMINWRYDLELTDGDVVFNLSSDFDTVGLGADWLRLITEWYQDGLIPRSIWLSIIKKNDIAPSDYDDEKGVEEINSDPVPARGRVEGADLMR